MQELTHVYWDTLYDKKDLNLHRLPPTGQHISQDEIIAATGANCGSIHRMFNNYSGSQKIVECRSLSLNSDMPLKISKFY